jgi:hypothetical protein
LGPSTIDNNRNSYNSVIQKTNDEQLLLNLVRLKYRDTPLFLEISNVTSQYRFSANANANATFPNSGFNLFEFGSGAGLSESPVVTYSPLQGQKFIEQFLAKMQLKSIFLLYKSGWSIERILRLCFEKMGPLDNAPNASGPTPELAPNYKEFLQAARLFRELQKVNALEIYMEGEKSMAMLIFRVLEKAKDRPEVQDLNKLFNSPLHNLVFRLGFNRDNKENSKFHIETRSLLGIMYYLSHAVESTEEALQNGYVTQTLDTNNKLFSWDTVTGDLLKVHSSSYTPDNASTTIFYDGHWYYVKRSDLNSKSTFSILGQIFYLQAGDYNRNSPLITIPIGSN